MLLRDEDVTGISGTGAVAEGIQFSDGQCVLHWLTEVSSLVVHENVANVERIHGHGGRTRVDWLD